MLPDNHLAPFPFPHGHDFDGSYPVNYRDSASVFFRRPGQTRPWIAAFQGDGRGLFQTSTRELRGRKLFTWGSNPGGQRWMDFLSTPGKGAYIELQAGVAPTQNQEFMLGAKQTLSWTECLAPVRIDPRAGHDADYAAACHAMETIIRNRIPDEVLAEQDAWMRTQAVRPINELLHTGRPWGMFHERMTGVRISPGLDFTAEAGADQCWAELLDAGRFAEETLAKNPTSWAVSDRWVDELERSAETQVMTWLHELFLGVARLDREQTADAKAHFERSKRLQASFLADRHLAVICDAEDDAAGAWAHYQNAWAQSGESVHLAVEICRFLQANEMHAELAGFVLQLPERVRRHERIRLAVADVALKQGDFARVREVLRGDFATIREGETLLTDLWFALHAGEAEQRKGSGLTPFEMSEVRRSIPPPTRIDFRMKMDVADG